MKHLIFVILFICFSFSHAKSQTITNVVAKQDGNKVVITYNLQCDVSADINLYVSEKGDGTFIGPLKSVTGDVGDNIIPGSKTITWNALQDQDMILGDNIVFRVKGLTKFGIMTDSRDGKTYKTVRIGTQTWMAENLIYKSANRYWAYDNNQINLAKYGYLYDWETAKNVCPTGWHLPSDDEWTILITFLGGETIAGGKLKGTGTTHWKSPNTGATNESGFTALPGGDRDYDGTYGSIGVYGYWWSSTEYSSLGAWYRTMHYGDAGVSRLNYGKRSDFSVRCLSYY
jgi:uncharacterized protein (TIGR02145 family)